MFNTVDHGTNYQVCTVMSEATSSEVSRALQDRCVRYFVYGVPDFQAEFERSRELHLAANADSPWEN